MTRDQTPAHNTITIEALATRVARAVDRFLRVSSLRISWHFFVRLRRKQECAGQQCMSPTWLVGRGGITANDVILVGLIHVTQGSWQPILQLNRYVFSQSSNIR
jgi:hypothetical protein